MKVLICSVAPEIFKLARFKKITAKKVLTNDRWMQGLQRMSNEDQLTQFVTLCEDLTDAKDTTNWSLPANASYSACAAYGIDRMDALE